MLALWKADIFKDAGLFAEFNGSAVSIWGINPYSGDGHVYFGTNVGFTATDTWTTGIWYLTGLTKASGSSTVRCHTYRYDTTTWTHTNYGNVSNGTNGSATELRTGWTSGADRLDGKMAACAVWTSVLTDLQIESLTARMSDWLALSPAWAVQFNQTNVAQNVLDLTNGGGNQSSLSGTSVSADEPSPWAYYTSQPGRWGVHI